MITVLIHRWLIMFTNQHPWMRTALECSPQQLPSCTSHSSLRPWAKLRCICGDHHFSLENHPTKAFFTGKPCKQRINTMYFTQFSTSSSVSLTDPSSAVAGRPAASWSSLVLGGPALLGALATRA